MRDLFSRKTKTQFRLRAFVSVCVAIVVLFVATTFIVGMKYDISPSYVGKQLLRQGILTVIYMSTLIYDPAQCKNAPVCPDEEQSSVEYEGYFRAEIFPWKSLSDNGLYIQNVHNEKIKRSRFPFSYQPVDEPRLHLLRKKYRLDNVVANARTEFEAITLLRNWARSQFKRSDFQPLMKNFDALHVLDRNYRNTKNEPWKPGMHRPCHFFPLLYSQILLSMGYQARLVRISHVHEGGYDGHGMTEVWSNQFKKWITMDADLNLHYERDGIPLNMLEIHNERYLKTPSRITILRGFQKSGDMEYEKEIKIDKMIPYHSYIQVLDMRNDWMTNHYFSGHPKRSDRSTLFWIDRELPSVFDFKQKTDNINDFYWTLNQTEIWVKSHDPSKNNIHLAFKTITPNFSHYEITVDDSQQITSTSSFFNWNLHPGNNNILVRSINKFGIKGIPSTVEIFSDQEKQKGDKF